MKKSVVLFGVLFLFLALAISLVAAQALPAPKVEITSSVLPAPPITMAEISKAFSTILTGPLALGETASDTFSRFLLFILLVTVLYAPAKIITKNATPSIIISTAVSILGLRFLTQELVRGILLPYGTLAVTVSVLLPLVLLAYFLDSITLVWIRKVGWIFAAAIFLGLWWTRWSYIGDLAWVYLVGTALSVGFFFFDGTIQRFFWAQAIKRDEGREAYMKALDIKERLTKAIERIPQATTEADRAHLDGEIKMLKEQIKLAYKYSE